MMGILDFIVLLTQLVPLVISIIKQVETPGNGPVKRDTVIMMVLEALNASLALAGKPPLSDGQIQTLTFFIGAIVDSIVGLFNKTGQFVHEVKVKV